MAPAWLGDARRFHAGRRVPRGDKRPAASVASGRYDATSPQLASAHTDQRSSKWSNHAWARSAWIGRGSPRCDQWSVMSLNLALTAWIDRSNGTIRIRPKLYPSCARRARRYRHRTQTKIPISLADCHGSYAVDNRLVTTRHGLRQTRPTHQRGPGGLFARSAAATKSRSQLGGFHPTTLSII